MYFCIIFNEKPLYLTLKGSKTRTYSYCSSTLNIILLKSFENYNPKKLKKYLYIFNLVFHKLQPKETEFQVLNLFF